MHQRVCVFCGSRSGHELIYAQAARDLARGLVSRNYGLVYGGGSIGLMGTLADAAIAAGGEVIGVIPESLARAEVAHDGITQLHIVTTMHERKALMAELSNGFVTLPGGLGTMEEFSEVLTWRQLGLHDKPIALLNLDGFYDRLLALYDQMQARGFMSAASRSLFTVTNSVDELLASFLRH